MTTTDGARPDAIDGMRAVDRAVLGALGVGPARPSTEVVARMDEDWPDAEVYVGSATTPAPPPATP